ncbi:sialic acid-binding Ig-like lectin 14 [Talpa occidentalis]|uniref:sialic acid-binding Ig-like lectin 14 n=1 Tax=Talpa occidentalis TaxID=50954 RepID=UPI0018909853|nr:sialic acid-binding Ig-like lectin 14 [Talpa occidentalis]
MGLLPSALLLLLPLLRGEGGPPQETPGFELRVQSFVRVQEGDCVSVSCSFSFPRNPRGFPTPHIYWFRDGDREYDAPVATSDRWRPVRAETRDRFLLPGDPGANNCSLSIRPARRADAGTYYLQVETGHDTYSFRKTKLQLDVTALTQKPDIHFGEPLRAGRPAKLACRLPGLCKGHSLSFSWAGEALASMDLNKLRSPELTLTPRPQDHGSLLTCRVAPPGPGAGTERTVRLDVAYAPQTVTVSIAHGNGSAFRNPQNASSVPVPEGQSLHLVCEAPSNPPASLSWFREGRALSPSGSSAPGVLELPRVGAGAGGVLTCLAQHPLGSHHVSFSLSVQRSPGDCSCDPEEPRGSWPLVLTLIRGALMGAGFLLTYGLTWLYYTRCGGT